MHLGREGLVHKVAVITGASSGIGQATALTLARQGIDLVLGARRLPLLEEVAAQCRDQGVRALPVKTDVTNQSQVDLLAKAAIDEFGGFDIWINNAGVTMVGSFMELSPDTFRRVIETNFFGCVYGAWAALRQFKAQEHGLLINVSSLFGGLPSPFESPYVASKYAVSGFSASLRQEMALTGQHDIQVCTVLPATIDTPIYRNAANESGQSLRPPGAIYPVQKVADAIAGLLVHPKAEVMVGGAGQMVAMLQRMLPHSTFEMLFGKYIVLTHFTKEVVPPTAGNLFEPGEYAGTSGNWSKPLFKRKQVYYAAGLTIGAIAALLLYAHKRKKRSDKHE